MFSLPGFHSYKLLDSNFGVKEDLKVPEETPLKELYTEFKTMVALIIDEKENDYFKSNSEGW